MTPAEALELVCKHGVVLESANGPVPTLSASIAGGPIRGSWWSHARASEIFAITRKVRDCPDVLVCRIVEGKITYVHRRLWPALVRLSEELPHVNLAQIHEMHTASGKHLTKETPFPEWVPSEIVARASALDVEGALGQLGSWLSATRKQPGVS